MPPKGGGGCEVPCLEVKKQFFNMIRYISFHFISLIVKGDL